MARGRRVTTATLTLLPLHLVELIGGEESEGRHLLGPVRNAGVCMVGRIVAAGVVVGVAGVVSRWRRWVVRVTAVGMRIVAPSSVLVVAAFISFAEVPLDVGRLAWSPGARRRGWSLVLGRRGCAVGQVVLFTCVSAILVDAEVAGELV